MSKRTRTKQPSLRYAASQKILEIENSEAQEIVKKTFNKFDAWRKDNKLSNATVRNDPTSAVQAWLDSKAASGATYGAVRMDTVRLSKALDFDVSKLHYTVPDPSVFNWQNV